MSSGFVRFVLHNVHLLRNASMKTDLYNNIRDCLDFRHTHTHTHVIHVYMKTDLYNNIRDFRLCTKRVTAPSCVSMTILLSNEHVRNKS